MKIIRNVVLVAAFAALRAHGAQCFSEAVHVTEAVERQVLPVKKIPGRAVALADVRVVPLVRGRIVKVAFRNGSSVKAGDLLYLVDSSAYEGRLRVAEARAEVARINAENARINYERRKSLAGRGVSQEALEKAQGERDAAAAALKEVQSACDIAKGELANCRICAPIDGIAGRTTKTEGDYIGDSSPLVNIVKLSPVYVAFSLSNGEFLRMFNGKSEAACSNAVVRLTLSDGTEFAETGSLEYVESVVDVRTDSIRMYALFRNAAGILRPGGSVSVTLSDKRPRKSIAVPLEAVKLDSKGTYVWVLDSDDLAVRRNVVCGRIDEGFRSVFSGLSLGERVVVDKGGCVVEGMKIDTSARIGAK